MLFAQGCGGRGADLSAEIKIAARQRFASLLAVPSTHLAPDMSQKITEQMQVREHLLASSNTLLSVHCCKVTALSAEHKNNVQLVQVRRDGYFVASTVGVVTKQHSHMLIEL